MKNSRVSRLRVCHIISGDTWGGAEAQAFALIKGLRELASIDVRVIVFNENALYKKLVEDGIETDIVDEGTQNALAMMISVLRIIRAYRPTIVHVHGFKENLVGGMAAKFGNIKVVRTHHGRGMIGVRRLFNFVEKLNGRFLSCYLIAVSDELKQFLVKFGLPAEKIMVVRNGVNCPSVSDENIGLLRAQLNLTENSFVIGTVARIATVKNQQCLLKAFRQVVKRNDNAVLLVVGDGPLLSEMKILAESLSISGNVIFVGFRENTEEYLRIMHIFALPSLHEGIPMSILEAMCAGVAVVAANVGGIPEIVRNNVSGILVPKGDCGMLANEFIRLMDNADLRESLTKNAKFALKTDFSFRNSLDRTVGLYSKVCFS